MDQRFCLVYNDRVVTPKNYKYKYEGKEYFSGTIRPNPEVLQKPDVLAYPDTISKKGM